MSSKVSPVPIVREQLGTLRNHRTGRPSVVDWLVLVGLPLVLGFAMWATKTLVVDAGQLLAGLAVLTGFVFGLLVFVFQLKLSATQDPRVPAGGILSNLLDELFANIAYTVLVGLVSVVLILVSTSIGSALPPAAGATTVLNTVWSAVVVGALAHFSLMLLMCLKRTHLAYKWSATH